MALGRVLIKGVAQSRGDLFVHRRVGRACRRITDTVDKLGNVQRTSSNGIDPLRISSTTS